jgi:hypothetical protein
MPQLNFRCTDEEKAAWDAIAGENLSGWIKDTLNAEVGRKGGTVAKVSQKRPGRPKKASVLESGDTVEAVQEKLAQVTKPILPLTGPEIPGEAPHREKYVKPPEPKPAPSTLPKAFWGALDRVKTPDQLRHDPATTQFKTAKPKKS